MRYERGVRTSQERFVHYRNPHVMLNAVKHLLALGIQACLQHEACLLPRNYLRQLVLRLPSAARRVAVQFLEGHTPARTI